MSSGSESVHRPVVAGLNNHGALMSRAIYLPGDTSEGITRTETGHSLDAVDMRSGTKGRCGHVNLCNTEASEAGGQITSLVRRAVKHKCLLQVHFWIGQGTAVSQMQGQYQMIVVMSRRNAARPSNGSPFVLLCLSCRYSRNVRAAVTVSLIDCLMCRASV